MNRIHLEHVAKAHQVVGQLTLKQKERLVDEIFQKQPNLLASVLALSRSNVKIERIDVILNILLLCFEAVRCAQLRLPVVTEAIQELCLARIAGRSRFIEGLSNQSVEQAVNDQVAEHTDKNLLALVFHELKEHGFSDVRTEQEKLCVLDALNLVETIAYVAKDA
ncbi:hypothetical protein [uncultured Thiodictyon sp.]|uniref:hypothetical protein n=1 Tax=uncultured Thiodictyon sp. TaxID=1846217 RepID=UPI0025FBDA6D|nr:hypothetical protein [uncultured Thiodictyon sp.]